MAKLDLDVDVWVPGQMIEQVLEHLPGIRFGELVGRRLIKDDAYEPFRAVLERVTIR